MVVLVSHRVYQLIWSHCTPRPPRLDTLVGTPLVKIMQHAFTIDSCGNISEKVFVNCKYLVWFNLYSYPLFGVKKSKKLLVHQTNKIQSHVLTYIPFLHSS